MVSGNICHQTLNFFPTLWSFPKRVDQLQNRNILKILYIPGNQRYFEMQCSGGNYRVRQFQSVSAAKCYCCKLDIRVYGDLIKKIQVRWGQDSMIAR